LAIPNLQFSHFIKTPPSLRFSLVRQFSPGVVAKISPECYQGLAMVSCTEDKRFNILTTMCSIQQTLVVVIAHWFLVWTTNGRLIGAMVRILAYYARGRGFDSRTVQIFVCINMSVCIGSGRFLCIVCMYLQKKYISMYIYPLSRTHNTSLVSLAYFGLDKCKCV
jgi:hypothetical protein